MNEHIYEQLLIQRLELVDEFMDETQIVRELKYFLLEMKYQSPDLDYTYETINTVLTNFYNYYNIEIAANFIEGVEINRNNYMNPRAIFNNILNLINVPLNIPPEVSNEHNEHPDDSLLNQVPYNDEHNDEHQGFVSNSFITVSLGGNEMQINTLHNNMDVNPLNIANLLNNMPLQYNMAPPQPSLPYMNFVTLLNNFMNQPSVPNNYDDVLVTLDDKEFENLVSKKLEEQMDYDCAVCLENMVKDEMVTELKCNHTYHTTCIEPYLKQYNYKCPVCRADVGKHKYNI